jgi:hypothetical protein
MDEYEEDVYYIPAYASLWGVRQKFEKDLELQEPTDEEEKQMPEDNVSLEEVIPNEEWATPVTPRARNAKERAKDRQVNRFEQQEAKRAPRVQIDQKITLYLWIAGIAIAFLASAFVSYNGITAVAEFVGLTATWMGSLFFFFIELMYLLFLVAYLLLSSRVQDNGEKERTFGAVMGMFSFGGVAVIANGFHTIDFWNYDFTEPRLWVGTLLAISAPLAIISASKMASRVVFAKAVSL